LIDLFVERVRAPVVVGRARGEHFVSSGEERVELVRERCAFAGLGLARHLFEVRAHHHDDLAHDAGLIVQPAEGRALYHPHVRWPLPAIVRLEQVSVSADRALDEADTGGAGPREVFDALAGEAKQRLGLVAQLHGIDEARPIGGGEPVANRLGDDLENGVKFFSSDHSLLPRSMTWIPDMWPGDAHAAAAKMLSTNPALATADSPEKTADRSVSG
jgi:hypothetical protein